jgi:hypothetical protein
LVGGQTLTCRHLPNSIGPERKSVDPLSTEYWPSAAQASPAKSLQRQALTDKTAQANVLQPGAKQTKSARHVPADDMDDFKAAVVGQDLTKVAMIEHLKKQYVDHLRNQADPQVPETAQRCDRQHARRRCRA